jgi:hypothetical protein
MQKRLTKVREDKSYVLGDYFIAWETAVSDVVDKLFKISRIALFSITEKIVPGLLNLVFGIEREDYL